MVRQGEAILPEGRRISRIVLSKSAEWYPSVPVKPLTPASYRVQCYTQRERFETGRQAIRFRNIPPQDLWAMFKTVNDCLTDDCHGDTINC